MTGSGPAPAQILAELERLRAGDAPTHGGHVLSYVYDSGSAELDELAASAIRLFQSVNGLDPTVFPSVARLESDLVAFGRGVLHGGDDVVGTVTTGGTESCLLAVKTARDLWHREHGRRAQPRVVAPTTVHPAFHKAAHYLDLQLDLVPVDVGTGAVRAEDLIARLDDDVALVVVSAPSYPHAALDPVAEVAAAAERLGLSCHVDACIGGLALPWWPGLAAWDFSVAGVTSISADLHKYGYVPKGASLLLHRGRRRRDAQYFATTSWPGYPVVNPTMLGSRSAGVLAAAWAITTRLGEAGYADLVARTREATEALIRAVGSIDGLAVLGRPAGPLFAVVTDSSRPERQQVDPHRWADAVRRHGWLLQQQPGFAQADGSVLPRSTHVTVTPVTLGVLGPLVTALQEAAEEVRGLPPASAAGVLDALPAGLLASLSASGSTAADLDQGALAGVLEQAGIGPSGTLPDDAAELTALIEALPPALVEQALIGLLGSLIDPQPRASR
ncbi:MAG: pyridoxal-dependent decarboxylase [Microcella sp.]|uniref:pyridoxal phosphate-dependent decarboxylase family protein n=1 Tax=Microcella sp. TaxID=1913979 RepID=UPI00331522EB